MKLYTYKNYWKFALLLIALVIGVLSLTYTNKLVKRMAIEERKNMEIWAQATSYLADPEGEDKNLNFYYNIITKNTTIPVILCDGNDSIIATVNTKPGVTENNKLLRKLIATMVEEHAPIVVDLLDGEINTIYYQDSTILRQLSIYPYVQLGVISLFILVAYFAFSSSRKAEQNKVWVGLSKETAHQLGTPISSLMAWLEILETTTDKHEYLDEMQKDINRLQTITERFSKVGSAPELPLSDLLKVMESGIEYMQSRTSKLVQFNIDFSGINDLIIPLSKSLFNWVIENIIKNAVDAMDGKGTITIQISETSSEAIIRIKDTGKGISKTKQRTIFKPGYTSKERGWGLGLSLVRRIIVEYHNGKIQVESSEINQGTTFKITLPK